MNAHSATIIGCAVVGLLMSIVGFSMASQSNQNWGESSLQIGLRNCAERWSPRQVEMTTQGVCRVNLDGEWWPENAIKVDRDG